MKRIVSLFACILIPGMLFAVSWSAGWSFGARYRTTAPDLFYYGFDATSEDVSFHFSGIGDDDFSFVSSYDLKVGDTIHNNFIFHTDNVPCEGGFATIGYLFSQQFAWDWFRLGYGIGIQSGISYSPYSPPFFSCIPLIDLRIGFETGPVCVMIYETMVHPDAMEFRLSATTGITAEFTINENHMIFADGFFELDNIMDCHTFVISGWGVKAGYRYRGTV